MLDRFRQSGRDVGVQDPVAAPRRAARARRRARRVDLEIGGDPGQPRRVHQPPGRGQQAQHPPALDGADGQPPDDQLVERARQGGGRQLAPGGQQLLGHERAPAGPFGDQQQQARRRALALDAFDQRGQLRAVEPRHRQPLERVRCVGDGRHRGDPRVVVRDDVRLVGGDQHEPLVRGDPGEERDQAAGRGIGAVEVLEDQHHRSPLAEPAKHPEYALHGPCLTAFWRPRADPVERPATPLEVGPQRREQPRDLHCRRSEHRIEVVVRERGQHRPDGPDQRPVRLVGAGGHRTTAEDGHRLAQRGDPAGRLVEEAADAHTRGAADQHRPGAAMGRIVEHGREPREGVLASDVPRAHVSAGHGPFYAGPCTPTDGRRTRRAGLPYAAPR